MPRVSSEILKCVAFVASKTLDGKHQYRGSAFLVGWTEANDQPDKVGDLYWVTAKHVISGIRGLGCEEVHLRLNTASGGAKWISTKLAEWYSDPDQPNCDLAVIRTRSEPWSDQLALPRAMVSVIGHDASSPFNVTDEVLVVGLFRQRAGNSKNFPIARMGSIASLAGQEPIMTPMGEMPLHLIEARSIGGLSGSPVFVFPGNFDPVTGTTTLGQKSPVLWGIIHGHFDTKENDIDSFTADSALSVENVNTGIAMVTPAWRLYHLIEQHMNKFVRIPRMPDIETNMNFAIAPNKPPSGPTATGEED